MSSASSADLVMADRLIEANGAREIFEDVKKGQMHTALQAAYVSLQSALDLVQSKAGLSEAPSEAELTQQWPGPNRIPLVPLQLEQDRAELHAKQTDLAMLEQKVALEAVPAGQ